MPKKMKSSYDEFIEKLSPKELEKFKEGYREFAISELILALMQQDDVSVRKLAKIAGVSPTLIQSMRSGTKNDFNMQSLFKVLKGLGCKKLMVEFRGQYIPLDILSANKR